MDAFLSFIEEMPTNHLSKAIHKINNIECRDLLIKLVMEFLMMLPPQHCRLRSVLTLNNVAHKSMSDIVPRLGNIWFTGNSYGSNININRSNEGYERYILTRKG